MRYAYQAKILMYLIVFVALIAAPVSCSENEWAAAAVWFLVFVAAILGSALLALLLELAKRLP